MSPAERSDKWIRIVVALINITLGYSVIFQIILDTSAGKRIADYILKVWIEYQLFVNIIGIALIFSLGYFLNAFKRSNQKLYGLTEIFLSITVSVGVINRYLELRTQSTDLQSSLGFFIPFVTAVYFTQRGFNNFFDGRDKEKLKSQGQNRQV